MVDSTVVVVPESTYLAVGKQVPHWIPFRGEITKIEFKNGNPFEGQVPCSQGHCKPSAPPRAKGTFPYSVTITLDGKEYKVDPQLIVG